MSDDDNLDEGEGIKSLRKQYEALKKEKDTLAEELGKFQAAQRTASVAETLKAKGIPETAASLYNGDDTSPEAVGKWVEQYAAVFGGVKPAEEQPDANAEAAARVSQASFGHPEAPSPQAGGKVHGNPEEIARALETLPYEELVKQGYMPATGGPYANAARR